MNSKLITTSTKEWVLLRKCVYCKSRKELEFEVEMITDTYEDDDGSQRNVSWILEVCPKCRAVDSRKKYH